VQQHEQRPPLAIGCRGRPEHCLVVDAHVGHGSSDRVERMPRARRDRSDFDSTRRGCLPRPARPGRG
jgi:hypothetical protein